MLKKIKCHNILNDTICAAYINYYITILHCRCVKLRKLILTNNRLVSLPVSVHHLPDLQTLDVRGNPDLVMPAKPSTSKFVYYTNLLTKTG